MDIYPSLGAPQPAPRRDHRAFKKLMSALGVLMLVGAAAYGVYVWQQSEAASMHRALQAEVKTLKQANGTAAQKEATAKGPTTYTTAGLTITLPHPYKIIVNVDGNRGGVPGAELKIGRINEAGIISDDRYEYVAIEHGTNQLTPEQDAEAVAANLREANRDGILIQETTIAGQMAWLVTADGYSYVQPIRVYVVKSGNYSYRLSSTSSDNTRNNEMFQALLDGTKIVEKQSE
ncbi:hypothetical protein JNJ66_07375 [Candidatus Saccharibacteria bacterium]|nr:hypothetical protein [Candidatus Saccharibacteria bacterium]